MNDTDEFDLTMTIKDVKDTAKNIWQKRFKNYGSYRFDKFIFNIMMFAIFGYLFFIAYSYDFNLDYYSCPGLEKCHNPFYMPTNWKNFEYLTPGEYGTKPGPLFNSIWYVVVGLFILAFGLNHVIYNRKRCTNENN